MNKKTIESLLKLIKTLDSNKQSKKLSEQEKLKNILDVFSDVPLDIKAQLERMKSEIVDGFNLPKDFKTSKNGSYIESQSLDCGDYDDILIHISGNFLEEDRIKLSKSIVYKLNH